MHARILRGLQPTTRGSLPRRHDFHHVRDLPNLLLLHFYSGALALASEKVMWCLGHCYQEFVTKLDQREEFGHFSLSLSLLLPFCTGIQPKQRQNSMNMHALCQISVG